MKTLIYILLTSLLTALHTKAQHSITEKDYVFDDSVVPAVNIDIKEEYLDSIFKYINLEKDIEYPATFSFSKNGIVDTMENVGFRLRGKTSRYAKKKSFKVAFNYNEKGRKYKGLDKMNLNAMYIDPTLVRYKVSSDLFRSVGVTASRVNLVELYINKEYRGIYANTEHVDDEFVETHFENKKGNLYKCRKDATLEYISDDGDDYKFMDYGIRIYELKTNKEEDDYSDLTEFIRVLNDTTVSDYKCQLERVFDVESYLKVIAMDLLIANWDGAIINSNNYYLYRNPATGKFVFIPYDLDSTIGVRSGSVDWWNTDIYDWPDQGEERNRPIYEHIMAEEEYRDKVSYYLQKFTDGVFSPDTLLPNFDRLQTLLTPYRADDFYSSLDFGYDLEDFQAGFNVGLNNLVPVGLKTYVERQEGNMGERIQPGSPLPSFFAHTFEVGAETIEVETEVGFPWNNEGSVSIFYQVNAAEWREQAMDKIDDHTYRASIAYDGRGSINYYVSAENIQGSIRYPRCAEETLIVGPPSGANLVINEFVASNQEGQMDEFGERDDWIELFNAGTEKVDLGAYFISDKEDNPDKFRLPSVELSPGEYYILWADEDMEQGSHHTNFKLSKEGEFIGLFYDSENSIGAVDSVYFGAQESDVSYGRTPNGIGSFQALPEVTFGSDNEGSSSSVVEAFQHKIRVFPNPSRGNINIESGEEIETLRILNTEGRVVRKVTDVGKNINLDLDNLSPGLYFIKRGGSVHKFTIIR